MSIEDKKKWDKKYIEKSQLLQPREASRYLHKYIEDVSGKEALELACGAGRNTIFLAKNGFHVDALDIATIALESLNQIAKNENISELISTKEEDLDTFTPQKNHYDLVVMSNFLDRALIKRVQRSLKVGAVFFIETYMKDSANNKEFANQDNMLNSGELKELFQDGFSILCYEEFENEASEMYRMKKQVIVAKRVD